MLTPILFFVFAFLTIGAMIWSGIQLIQVEENPLDDRLDELQSQATSTAGSSAAATAAAVSLIGFLFLISHVPGMDDYLNDTEKELAQAGIRNRQALGAFVLGHVAFMALMIGGMIYLQRDNPFSQKFGGIVAAFLLGWLLPNQILHRLVKRYRPSSRKHCPTRWICSASCSAPASRSTRP